MQNQTSSCIYLWFQILQIDFDKWTNEDEHSDDPDEGRDIIEDFPGLYERMQAEELGWPSKSG